MSVKMSQGLTSPAWRSLFLAALAANLASCVGAEYTDDRPEEQSVSAISGVYCVTYYYSTAAKTVRVGLCVRSCAGVQTCTGRRTSYVSGGCNPCYP